MSPACLDFFPKCQLASKCEVQSFRNSVFERLNPRTSKEGLNFFEEEVEFMGAPRPFTTL